MTAINRFLLVLIGANLLLLSCEKEPVYDVNIVTDASSYTMSDSTIIQVTLSNHSDSTVYYICTGQVYLEQLSDQQKDGHWMVHGFEECLGPGPISPDERDTFMVNLGFLHKAGHLDDALFNSTVSYRLRFDLFEEETFRNLLEGSNILSNTFQVIQ